MIIRPYIILYLLFCFATNYAHATSDDNFQAGLQAFKNKQYSQAIQLFNKAQQDGMKTPALYYNLAVSHIKVGNYKQARTWLNKTRQDKKLKYLSEYNLGLVALKQGDKKTALQHFRLVSKNAKQTNLIKLANYQISQLINKPTKSWLTFAQLEYGHDNNVTTAIDGSPSKLSSSYIDVYVFGSLVLAGTSKQGLTLDGYILDTQYQSAGQFDLNTKGLKLKQSLASGKWRHSAGIGYNETNLGGQDYEEVTLYDIRTQYALSSNNNLRLRYRYYDINSLPPYTELSGNKQRLRLEYRQYLRQDKLKFYYEYEINDRSETSTTASNYSPTRNTLRGAYTYTLNDNLALTGDLAYRTSQYPAGAVNPAREETRTKANLELSYYLNKVWSLSAAYEHTHNDSDNIAYRYDRNISSISIGASF